MRPSMKRSATTSTVKASIIVTTNVVPRAQHGAFFSFDDVRLRGGFAVCRRSLWRSFRAARSALRDAECAARRSAASCNPTSQKPPQYDDDVDSPPEVDDLLSTMAMWPMLDADFPGGFAFILLRRSALYESILWPNGAPHSGAPARHRRPQIEQNVCFLRLCFCIHFFIILCTSSLSKNKYNLTCERFAR